MATVWQALTVPPPAEAAESQQGVGALRAALTLLQRALPPAPLGTSLYDALAGASSAATLPAMEVQGGALGAAPAVLLLRALIVGLSSWVPSWLLSDVAAYLWTVRGARESEFGLWLSQALAANGVPRGGLGAEQKAALGTAMLEAKSKAHFKAALKQMTGGKKKNTAGTPALS